VTERDELLAALQQTATFAERLLELSRRLFDELDSGRPLSPENRATLAAGLEQWGGEMAKLRGRIDAAVRLKPPPDRAQ
jgi:hypothetical protein